MCAARALDDPRRYHHTPEPPGKNLVTLHHGTRLDLVEAIVEGGLVPHRATRGFGVWATSSFDLAVHYSMPVFRPTPGAVFTFVVDLDVDHVHEDRPGRWVVGHAIAPDRLTVDVDPVCSCHGGADGLTRAVDGLSTMADALVHLGAATDSMTKGLDTLRRQAGRG